MKAKTNTDYYNILLQGCKEAFEAIELKEFLYTDEAMIDNTEIKLSNESIIHFGIEKSNNIIVNYRIKENITIEFLQFLERQQLIFEKKHLIARNDFYKKCLNALNIKLTEWNKDGNRKLRSINDMETPPNPLEFLEYMKDEIKYKSLQLIKTPELKNPEAVKPDEKYKTQNLFKVGLLFATGEMNKYYTINSLNEIVLNNGLSPLKIAKELGNPSFEKYILASKNNYKDAENKGKNIFSNLDMMNKIISHCKVENIEIEPCFISRLPIE